MAGYQRQDTTGQLANGNPIDADIFNDEYDAIEGAFNASSGHTHDGTAGGGAPIESIGPSQELEVTSSSVFPKVHNLIDHGKTALRWKDGHYGGTVYATDGIISNDLSVGGNLTVTGDTTINGNLTFGDAATDTINFNADVDSDIKPETTGTYNLGSSTQEWNDIFIDGTATVDMLTVDEDATVAGTLDVIGDTGIDGNFDVATNKFTVDAATGDTVVAGTFDATGNSTIGGTLDITGVTNVDDTTGSTSITTGALVVDGGVGIAENLYVGGLLDTVGDITTAGNVSVAGTFNSTGNFSVTSNFIVDASTGNTSIAGTLAVIGDTTVENLFVNGNTTLGDAATDTVTVNADIASDLIPDATGTRNIGSATDEWNNLYIDGVATIDDLVVDQNATVAGTLDVTGATGIDGNFDVATNKFTVDSATGNTAIAGTLAVTGASTMTGAVTATGGVVGDLTGNVTGNLDGIVGGTTPAAVTGTTVQFNTGLTDGTTTITGFVDEDDMVSDSATLIPTQQSVKAYVDSSLTSGSGSLSASSVSTGSVDLGGGTGWVIEQDGTSLKFVYNGTARFTLTSGGELTVSDNVTAYGTP